MCDFPAFEEFQIAGHIVSSSMTRVTNKARGKARSLLGAIVVALCPGLFCGCGNKFWDPTQIGRMRPLPAVNVILDSLGVAEEMPTVWEGAEEPLPVDAVASVADYALRPGDTVTIEIFELLREGVSHINNYLVTETGRIRVPQVGEVKAAGLTETQLEEHIEDILSPAKLDILKKPVVSVTLVNSQQRAFSIQGDGVRFPNRYPIPRYDYRLMDAIATAGGSSQFNVSYIYVSRPIATAGGEAGPIDPGFGELELEVIEPQSSAPLPKKGKNSSLRAQYQWPKSKVVVASSEMISGTDSVSPNGSWQFDPETGSWEYVTKDGRDSAPVREQADEPVSVDDLLRSLEQRSAGRIPGETEDRIDDRARLRDAMTSPPRSTIEAPIDRVPDQNDLGDFDWEYRDGQWVAVPREVRIQWEFRNGKWVPVQVGAAEPVITVQPDRPATTPGRQVPVVDVERAEAGTRLIRIPAEKLFEPRYNIVIKPGDSIFVPVDIVGECSIMGNVNRAGFINITGRPITLKQAIAAAGGLGPLAWPKRCEIVRRIGREKEEIVMLDLDKIASGEQPDVFIKPHDLINVGTHATARWRAVLRNAFRATYGFGFVYDRNFANKDFFGQTFNYITPWKWDKVF